MLNCVVSLGGDYFGFEQCFHNKRQIFLSKSGRGNLPNHRRDQGEIVEELGPFGSVMGTDAILLTLLTPRFAFQTRLTEKQLLMALLFRKL